MAEINLAPFGANKISSSGKIYNLLALITSSILISLTVIGFAFFFSKRYKAKTAFELSNSKEHILKNEIIALDPDSTKEFQKKVGELDALLKEHIYWSEIFPIVEDNTIPTVWYSSLSVSLNDKSIDLEGKAKNLDGAARQIVSFKQEKKIQEVGLNGIGSDSAGTIRLSLGLKFDENLIKINKKTNSSESGTKLK